MSMPSNSLKNNTILANDDFVAQNDSEAREALFLKRMQNKVSKTPDSHICESSLRFDRKPVEKSHICVSNVKLRLKSIPKTDEAFFKMGLTRRIKKMTFLDNLPKNPDYQGQNICLDQGTYEVW